jgi:hypothetical protein
MSDWTSDLEAAVEKKGDQFLLARSDDDGLKEYAVLPFDKVGDTISAAPETTFYEVVLEGKCFLHLIVHFGETDQDEILQEVVTAMHKALPDIPLKDMQPHVSLSGIPGCLELRVVYRDVVLDTLGACRQIAENVAALLQDPKSVQLDVYRHGHCSPILGRIGASG